MTVAEVIEQLQCFEPSCNVYVPDTRDGTAQIVQQVSGMVHLNGIEGVKIPDDVCLTPWAEDEEGVRDACSCSNSGYKI